MVKICPLILLDVGGFQESWNDPLFISGENSSSDGFKTFLSEYLPQLTFNPSGAPNEDIVQNLLT